MAQIETMKLLFVTYYFPPINAIASSRTWYIAKYLDRMGWDIHIATPNPDHWRDKSYQPRGFKEFVTKNEAKMIYTGLRWRGMTPSRVVCEDKGSKWFLNRVMSRVAVKLSIEPEIGWVRPLNDALMALGNKRFDAILVSGGPFCSFPAVAEISERRRCPLYLDYRDLWSENPHLTYLTSPRNQKLEQRVMHRASRLITVSETYSQVLERMAPGKKADAITNGFDPEAISGVMPKSEKFPIVYLGSLYPPTRDLSAIFKALDGLKRRVPLKGPLVHYFGPSSSHVSESAKAFSVQELICIHPQVTRTEALQVQLSSSLAIVVISNNQQSTDSERGIITGKVFELLGCGTPMLIIAPEDAEIRRMLRNTSGLHFAAAHEVQKIGELLYRYSISGRTAITPPPEFSWPNLAMKLSNILKSGNQT